MDQLVALKLPVVKHKGSHNWSLGFSHATGYPGNAAILVLAESMVRTSSKRTLQFLYGFFMIKPIRRYYVLSVGATA